MNLYFTDKVYFLYLKILLVLNVLDLGTSLIAFNIGGFEYNQFMLDLIYWNYPIAILIKLFIPLIVVFILNWAYKLKIKYIKTIYSISLSITISVYLIIVLGNTRAIYLLW